MTPLTIDNPITVTAICNDMGLTMTIALSQEIGRRLHHAGWARIRATNRSGARSWSYRHSILLARSTIADAVRDLLDQRAIAHYRRKSDATSGPSAYDQLMALAESVKAAAPVACDYADRRHVVIPIDQWEAITASLPGAGRG